MNFRQYLSIFEAVIDVNQSADVSQGMGAEEATQLVVKVAQNSFGKLPQVKISDEVKLGRGGTYIGAPLPSMERRVHVDSPNRKITIYIRDLSPDERTELDSFLPQTKNIQIPIMDIGFSWPWNREPKQKSPKDHSAPFPISSTLDPETMPLVNAFKAFLTQMRNYPILAIYIAIHGRSSHLDDSPNRRASLYKRIFQNVGYTNFGVIDTDTWFPPVLANRR